LILQRRESSKTRQEGAGTSVGQAVGSERKVEDVREEGTGRWQAGISGLLI
jgi:hypothetical protein